MKIVGWIFLYLGIMALLLAALCIQVDGRIDLFNAGTLTVGIMMTLCGIWFFVRDRDPDLKSLEDEMEERKWIE